MIVPFTTHADSDQSTDNDLELGHTAISGYSTQHDSNFVFGLTGRFYYRDLTLRLFTFSNSSDYEIFINNRLKKEGTFRDTHTLNISLDDYDRVDLTIFIDQYRYELRNKLITQRTDSSDWSVDHREEGQFYTATEISLMTARIMALVLVFTLITLPIANYIVDERLNAEIQELV